MASTWRLRRQRSHRHCNQGASKSAELKRLSHLGHLQPATHMSSSSASIYMYIYIYPSSTLISSKGLLGKQEQPSHSIRTWRKWTTSSNGSEYCKAFGTNLSFISEVALPSSFFTAFCHIPKKKQNTQRITDVSMSRRGSCSLAFWAAFSRSWPTQMAGSWK